jgi:uncharacterized protein (DUF1501 family)
VSHCSGRDHGWGSHHFVAGGAVKGRAIYGQFPATAHGTDTDLGSGRLLPSTSGTELRRDLGAVDGTVDQRTDHCAAKPGELFVNERRLSLSAGARQPSLTI